MSANESTTNESMTYEEWLAEQRAKSEAKVEADYTSAKNDINTTYDETVKRVESDHQRTLTDIDTSYQKNLAGYGRNAELLASMGLTNSGYSDYLNSQAFAQKSSTTRSANRDRATLLEGADKSRKSALESAAATRENALNSIDTTYQSAIFDYRSDNFNKLYTNALNGMYAGLEEEALNKLITENHLTSDQAEEVKSAISFYNTQKADTDKKTAFDNISALASSGHFYGKTDDEIRTQIASYGFSNEQVDIILRANALYTEDKNEKNAQKDEKTKQEAYNSILALAQSGRYANMSDDEIKAILAEYGFSSYSVEAILEANKDYKDGKARNDLEINNQIYTAFVENVYNGIYSSVQDVQSALKLQGVGEDSDLWKSVVSAYQTENSNTILYSIEQGYTYTESQLETLVTSGEITEDQKQRISNVLRNKQQSGGTGPTVQPGEDYYSANGINSENSLMNNINFGNTPDAKPSGSVKHEWGDSGTTNYDANSMTTTGNVNGKEYKVVANREYLTISIGEKTHHISNGDLYTSGVNQMQLIEAFGEFPGRIVVVGETCYVHRGAMGWARIDDKISKEMINEFKGIDTSYGANVGTGTGGSASGNINNRPNQFSQVVLR